MLVLRIGQDNEGNPMTMKRIVEIVAARMPYPMKLLNIQADCNSPTIQKNLLGKNASIFENEPLKTEWVLIGKEFVNGTLGQDYAHQTLKLYEMMKERNLMTAEEERENIHLENKLKQLYEKAGINWNNQSIDDEDKCQENWISVVREIADLPINRRHRRKLVGILFDWVVRFMSRNGEGGQLEKCLDYSNSLSVYGPVALGDFNIGGGFLWWHSAEPVPDFEGALEGVGAVFSRSCLEK